MVSFIKVGGKTTPTGGPDPTIAFSITVRDFANNPIAGSNVVVGLAACSDSRICPATVGFNCTGGPGGTPIVSGLTNAAGQVTFSILGASTNYGSAPCTGSPLLCPGAGQNCANIAADGVPLGNATLIDYDEDGGTGVPPGAIVAGDQSKLKADIAAYTSSPANYRGRSDFSATPLPSLNAYHVDANDLSFQKTIIGAASGSTGSGSGCRDSLGNPPASYCP